MSRPLNGKRPSKYRKKKSSAIDHSIPTHANDPRYRLLNVDTIATPRRIVGLPKLPRALRKEPIFAGPDHQVFSQMPRLPIRPGRVGITHLLDELPPNARNPALDVFDFAHNFTQPDSGDPLWGLDMDAVAAAAHVATQVKDKKGRHLRRRTAQFQKWNDIIIPALLPLYLSHQCSTQGGRKVASDSSSADGSDVACSCHQVTRIAVTAVYWNGKYHK